MKYNLIAAHEKDSRANRDGYIQGMLELMEQDNKVMHLDCDLMSCINAGALAKAYPNQVFNGGIAEQNAVGVAAGMVASGLTVYIHSFGCFASRRCFDQAFLSAGYSNLPVHILGSDPGVTASYNGGTHMPFEDAALFLTMPNAVVLDCCDFAQTKSLTKASARCDSPSYLRLIRKDVVKVYEDGSEFEIGKGVTLKKGTDVTIIASGIMVDEALKAEEQLKSEGISATIVDMFTWKPLDEALIVSCAEKTGCIVTAENHQVSCGLGSAVANVLVEQCPVPLERVGIQNRYGQVGPQGFLMEEYNLLAKDIVLAAKKAISRKK